MNSLSEGTVVEVWDPSEDNVIARYEVPDFSSLKDMMEDVKDMYPSSFMQVIQSGPFFLDHQERTEESAMDVFFNPEVQDIPENEFREKIQKEKRLARIRKFSPIPGTPDWRIEILDMEDWKRMVQVWFINLPNAIAQYMRSFSEEERTMSLQNMMNVFGEAMILREKGVRLCVKIFKANVFLDPNYYLWEFVLEIQPSYFDEYLQVLWDFFKADKIHRVLEKDWEMEMYPSSTWFSSGEASFQDYWTRIQNTVKQYERINKSILKDFFEERLFDFTAKFHRPFHDSFYDFVFSYAYHPLWNAWE